jgi:hypothetical protein
MDKQFNITWYKSADEVPRIGGVCEKCQRGEIKNSKFFNGVYCSDCKWSWRPSKFTNNKPTESAKIERIGVDSSALIMEELASMRKHFDDRLDAMAEFFVTKIIKDEE